MDGDAVGAYARVGQETYVTAYHVVESLSCELNPPKLGENPRSFHSQFGDDENHYNVVVNQNPTSDWAQVYTSAPLKGPILEMGPFVPEANVEIYYANNGVKKVFNGPLCPIEGVYGYATIADTPFVPGTSGLPVLHRGRLVGIFVGKQRTNGIVSLVNPEYDSLSAISRAVGDIDLYGKKKLSRFVRSGKISSADYAEKVKGLTLRFGRPPTSYEIAQEVDYHYMYEQDAYADDEEDEDDYDTYFESGDTHRYLNPFEELDFEAESGDFEENDAAEYEREKRYNTLTGKGTLRFEGYGKKKTTTPTHSKVIVRPTTQFELIPPTSLDADDDTKSVDSDVEILSLVTDLLVDELSKKKEAQPAFTNPFDDPELFAEAKAPQVFTSPIEAFGYKSDQTTKEKKVSFLEESAPAVVQQKLLSYAEAAKSGSFADMINNLPSTSEMSKARMAAEVAALKREIKILNDQGIVAMDPVVLTSHEIEKYPAAEHIKQALNKELKVLKSIKGVRERKEAEREVQQKRAMRIQEAMNVKTRELAEMKAQLEKLQASTSSKKNF